MQTYETLEGVRIPLDRLDDEERRLFERLSRYAARNADWDAFTNRSWEWITDLYVPRGLSVKEILEQPLYYIAEDLEGRLAIAEGKARDSDYRDDLADLIEQSGTTCYKLARKAHISESQLSHVLKGRKNLSLAKLSALLDALGHRITFVPKAGIRTPTALPRKATVNGKRRSRATWSIYATRTCPE